MNRKTGPWKFRGPVLYRTKNEWKTHEIPSVFFLTLMMESSNLFK